MVQLADDVVIPMQLSCHQGQAMNKLVVIFTWRYGII